MSENKRKTIGYVIPKIWGETSIQYYQGVVKAAEEHGVNLVVIVGQSLDDRSDFQPSSRNIYNLIDPRIYDGIILWGSQIADSISLEEFKKLHKKLQPLPMVSIATPLTGSPVITMDNYAGIQSIMKHLISEHDCKKIGFIKGPEKNYYSDVRFESYCALLSDYGLPFDEKIVSEHGVFEHQTGESAIRLFLDTRNLVIGKDLDSIVSVSDTMSLGAVNELKRRGFRIPNDIVIVGFNNRYESRLCFPALTTIDPSLEMQGRKAVEVLISMIDGNVLQSEEFLMPIKLVVRQSCGCLEVNNKETTNEGSENCSWCTPELLSGIAEMMTHQVKGTKDGIDADWAHLLIDKFMRDLKTPESHDFIDYLESIIRSTEGSQGDVFSWHGVISVMRKTLLSFLNGTEYFSRAINIIHNARILINQTVESSFAYLKINFDYLLNMLHQADKNLMSTFVLMELMDVVEKILPDIGTRTCFISTYNNLTHSDTSSRLIFAYNEGRRINIESRSVLNDQGRFIPDGVMTGEKPYKVVVYPLCFRETMLGFAVFDEGNIDAAFYQLFSGQISSAIYRSKIFERLQMTEDEREYLLQKLEHENAELERKVQQRTSDIIQVNTKLKNAIDEAVNANRAKSSFLANMSHEIRTPLNCILGFSEIISNTTDVDQHKRYSDMIIHETEKLTELVNQILDLSKIEADKIRLNPDYFNFLHFMDSIVSTYQVISKTKGLEFYTDIAGNIPEILNGDALRLRQILVNLIGNAIKFTLSGSITVSVRIHSTGADYIYLVFRITDTGIGIAKERQSSIFDLFVQAEDSITRKFGGTGLGTSIAKQLVQLMDGEIGVESMPGNGSEFWFTARLGLKANTENVTETGKTEEPDRVTSHFEQFKTKRIMLVEDYRTNRELAVAHLRKIGSVVCEVENGKEAIEKFPEFKPDLILMDIQMPEMDGCQATKVIRNLPDGSEVIIIGMTANAYESDIIHYLNTGMDDVITKPFRRERFLKTIVDWLISGKRKRHVPSNFPSDRKSVKDIIEEIGRCNYLVDIKRNFSDLDGNIEFFRDIMNDFFNNIENQITRIRGAIDRKDYGMIISESHTIKGAALNLMMQPVALIARQLEMLGKAEETDGAHDMLSLLEKVISDSKKYLHDNDIFGSGGT